MVASARGSPRGLHRLARLDSDRKSSRPERDDDGKTIASLCCALVLSNASVRLVLGSQRLNSFNSVPEYPAYLVHIMNMSEADERLRSVAGLVLKNNAVAQFASWPAHVVDYVKQIIMSTFHDQPTMVRNSAGGVIVAILDMVGPGAWPEVLQLLLQSLDSPSIDQQLVSRRILNLGFQFAPQKKWWPLH